MPSAQSVPRDAVAIRVRHAWLLATCLAGLSGCGSDAAPAAEDAASGSGDSAADLAVADAPGDATPAADVADAGADAPADATAAQDPLVGTWTFSGHVPAIVTITFALKADWTFTLAETVAPPTWPAGYVPTSCVTTHSLFGTYAKSAPGGVNTLTLTISGGLANTVSGCEDATSDATGTPMTPEDVTGYTAQGLLLPAVETYTVNATTLVLTPPGGYSKTFAKL